MRIFLGRKKNRSFWVTLGHYLPDWRIYHTFGLFFKLSK